MHLIVKLHAVPSFVRSVRRLEIQRLARFERKLCMKTEAPKEQVLFKYERERIYCCSIVRIKCTRRAQSGPEGLVIDIAYY